METECLVEEVLKRASVIENKRTDAVTWKQKESAWADLAVAFNAQTATNRTVKTSKIKYEGIKRIIKQKHTKSKAEQFKTGGGAATIVMYTPWEEKLLRLISLSVKGLQSRNDSDTAKVTFPEEKDENEVNMTFPEERDINEVLCTYIEDDTNSEDVEEIHIISEENEQLVEEFNNSNKRNVNWDAWNPATLRTPRNKKLKTNKSISQENCSSLITSRTDLIEIQKKVAEQELAKIALEMEFLRKEDARKEKIANQQLAKLSEEMEFLRKEDARKEAQHQLKIILLQKNMTQK